MKFWSRLSQDFLACVGDVLAVHEVECLEIRTSSSYFHHTGVCDSDAAIEVECLEIRTSSCYFRHARIGDVAAVSEVE